MDGTGGDWRGQQQGPNSAAAGVRGDWRDLLSPVTRMGVVIMLKETLRKHMPIPELQSQGEIQKEALRIEEMLYAAATSEPEYMWKAFGKKLSMENQTDIRQASVNVQVVPEQNPVAAASGLLPQGCNLEELSTTPLMSQQAGSLPVHGPGFSQTSTLQDMSGVPRNTMKEGFTQGNPQDIISAGQRKLMFQKQQMPTNLEEHQKPLMQKLEELNSREAQLELLWQRLEELIRKNDDLQRGQSSLHELIEMRRLQLITDQQSLKLHQSLLEVIQHYTENDVNEQKIKYLVIRDLSVMLLCIGISVATWFI